MIRDLSVTLQALLSQPGLPPELTEAHIIFDRPTEPFTPPPDSVDLFLYDIRENVELRSNEPIVERFNGQARIRRPPRRVACSYLVTAWAGDGDGEEVALQEHRLLSQVLQVLSYYPTIPAEFLRGSLVGQEPPLPMLTAPASGLQNPAEFWTAVGNKLRPSLTVTVTISMPVLADVTGPLVTTRFTRFGVGSGVVEETLVQIGGRVLSPQVAAVQAQAMLSTVSNNQATVTAEDAANFRPGDIVFLQKDGTSARATIASIDDVTITFQRPLTNANDYTGGTMRIADLIPGQRTMRLDSTTGIEPGLDISITQAPTTESRIVQSVDRVNNVITLAQGLTNTYTMQAASAPVNIVRGIAGALVDIVDAGLQAKTDAEGRYTFLRVPPGRHEIRAVVDGFEPKTQPLVVPARPEDLVVPARPEEYDIIVTPL